MLKKTVTYKNFNDEEVTEDFYFHLSKVDLMELETSKPHGLKAWIENIENVPQSEILSTFQDLLRRTYGVKSEDGKHFHKTDEYWEMFKSTNAYEKVFMDICTSQDTMAEFMNGIVPEGAADDVAKIQDKPNLKSVAGGPKGHRGGEQEPTSKNPRVLTWAEMLEMPQEELSHLLATGKAVIGSQ